MNATAPTSLQTFVDKINAIPVHQYELMTFLMASNRLPQEYQNVEGGQSLAAAYYPHSFKATVVLYRIQALMEFIGAHEQDPWLCQLSHASGLIHEAYLAAAATHPLCIHNNQIAFTTDSFTMVLLEFIAPRGHA